MDHSLLTVQVPGKLMIAGEFAVLERSQTLIVTAVDRFVYAEIKRSKENRLSLKNLNINKVKWEWDGTKKEVKVYTDDKRVNFVKDAMTITIEYLHEQSIYPECCTLHIHSELDDSSGAKYGLGSSAAVVTSVVSSLLKKFLPYPPTEMTVFKLAAISHLETQGSGSGADIAASTFGGVLQYSSFNADWLKAEYANAHTVTELVEKDWRYLTVKQIQIPRHVHLCVGWTGKPASTSSLVKSLLQLKKKNASQYEQFLINSEKAVAILLQGIKENSIPLLFEGVKRNRQALSTVGEQSGVEIETPLLQKLCELAEQHNGAGKSSGAGGGDCGIAFVSSSADADKLMQAWETNGIKPLPLKTYFK